MSVRDGRDGRDDDDADADVDVDADADADADAGGGSSSENTRGSWECLQFISIFGLLSLVHFIFTYFHC